MWKLVLPVGESIIRHVERLDVRQPGQHLGATEVKQQGDAAKMLVRISCQICHPFRTALRGGTVSTGQTVDNSMRTYILLANVFLHRYFKE